MQAHNAYNAWPWQAQELDAREQPMQARGMPTKKRDSIFSDAQARTLVETVAKARKKFKNQEELALAIGITQPSLSNFLRGKWRPGLGTAQAIAHLDGRTLEELVGPVRIERAPDSSPSMGAPRFPNLEVCVRFHDGTRSWSAWTLAAAREGYFGEKDLPAPSWAAKLDELEASMRKSRKQASP